MLIKDPRELVWQYSVVPPVEWVPADCWIFVWGIGYLSPHGDRLNTVTWCSMSLSQTVTDGCWYEGPPTAKSDDGFTTYILGTPKMVLRKVWWAWADKGTPGLKHKYKTRSQEHGFLVPDRDDTKNPP